MFVALDNGPGRPLFPGVGFIAIPELSWRHINAPTDVVEVGQRVLCEFLRFDTYNAEARLSLRGTRPDPFQAFADHTSVGQELRGTVTRVLPFGAFVEVGDGIEGLVPSAEVHGKPTSGPAETLRPDDKATFVVTDIGRPQRRLLLSRAQQAPTPMEPDKP